MVVERPYTLGKTRETRECTDEADSDTWKWTSVDVVGVYGWVVCRWSGCLSMYGRTWGFHHVLETHERAVCCVAVVVSGRAF